MALVTGPGRFEEAAASAFALSLLLVVGGTHRRGSSFKLLELFDVAYFGTMAALALFASDRVIDWLEKWGGEMTNVALVAFALGSILVRQPFTLQYARETTEPEYWTSPLFLRINYVITWAWVGGFAVAAISGAVGDIVLDDPNNFWTGWIIQIGGTVFAIAFTEFYPDYATYHAAVREGVADGRGTAEHVPSVRVGARLCPGDRDRRSADRRTEHSCRDRRHRRRGGGRNQGLPSADRCVRHPAGPDGAGNVERGMNPVLAPRRRGPSVVS